jgi:hypothetical protein
MVLSKWLKICISGLLALMLSGEVSAQRFLSEYDSTLFMRDTLIDVVQRFDNLRFSGYMQPQFQVAGSKGAPSYNGGNFSEFANNRFLLRRARVKLDYIIPAKEGNIPRALFSFQFDATERGVNVRDMFARVYEPRNKHFSATTGLFARPFGFELTYSSAFRETPERGRMSQILMPTERDLGAMVSYETRSRNKKSPLFKWDAGVFNGQGLTGTMEFDSYKDFISRITMKPYKLTEALSLSTGLSLLRGGWQQGTRYRYEMNKSGEANFTVDSSLSNLGGKAPRHYYGADAQLVWKHGWGKSEWRAEYWKGTQPGTASTTVNPGILPTTPTYIRQFDGAYFYYLHNFGKDKWQFVAKYDWYDPNTKVTGNQIGSNGSNLGAADVRFSTVVIGMNRWLWEHIRLMAFYDIVRNERTNLTGYTDDIDDDVFTFRIHFIF